MTTPTQDDLPSLAPNHHADHPAFDGLLGYLAALSFLVGRGRVADLAISLADVGPRDDVVDVGCGPGVAARKAAVVASSVVGVDPSIPMLRIARAIARVGTGRSSAVRWLEGTAESLPLDDDSATVVWSLATVHHWRDLEAGLAEARRVLRPGGRMLVVERHVAPGGRGYASHGWTESQAQSFAERCRQAGFTTATVDQHRVGRRDVLTVLVVKA
ncbi:MAG TPA: class I SAM-dependent methyltransferase [Mycobacteriales bacterium]|nr:class I SAM-dependent methyltransferase [Mycobacteriales bacterium]